jgi:hypothetical protein
MLDFVSQLISRLNCNASVEDGSPSLVGLQLAFQINALGAIELPTSPSVNLFSSSHMNQRFFFVCYLPNIHNAHVPLHQYL